MSEVQIYAAHLTAGDWQAFGGMDYAKVTRVIRAYDAVTICYLDRDPSQLDSFDEVTVLSAPKRATAYRKAWRHWLKEA